MKPEPLFPIEAGNYRREAEPWVRIGVILAEDGKQEAVFHLPAREYLIQAGTREIRVQGRMEGPYRVIAGERTLDLADQEGERVLSGEARIRVSPAQPYRDLKPGDGVRVEDIVAGRGFHWIKQIDQTLTGELEFSCRDGRIVMVNRLPLEEYLTGVITGEMSGECPEEFMKAQAVAARSWLLATPFPTHPDDPFDWCNDDHCQRYQGTSGWSERRSGRFRDAGARRSSPPRIGIATHATAKAAEAFPRIPRTFGPSRSKDFSRSWTLPGIPSPGSFIL